MDQLLKVVEAYRTASPYAGFKTFGFDLNQTLRIKGEEGLDTDAKRKAFKDLNDSFKSCQLATGDFVLYRGACGHTVTPFLTNSSYKTPAFSSTSLDILTAVRLVHACDEISDGLPYLFKISGLTPS